MKPHIIAILAAIGALCLLLLPHKEFKVGARPDNLWTHDGEWKTPSNSHAVLSWNRTEYGLRWAWLVHDSEVGGESWYAKAVPHYLTLYILSAGSIGLAAYWIFRRILGTKRGTTVQKTV